MAVANLNPIYCLKLVANYFVDSNKLMRFFFVASKLGRFTRPKYGSGSEVFSNTTPEKKNSTNGLELVKLQIQREKKTQPLVIISAHTCPWVNCEMSFSVLREDAFGAFDSLRSISLIYTLWFNFCTQIVVVKHNFNSMHHKIVSVEEISYAYICK